MKGSEVEADMQRMQNSLNKFDVFLNSNISGHFVVNPYWLEHLLNLFYQEYMGEVWEEVHDTLMNHKATIENAAYGIIGKEFRGHSPTIKTTQGVSDE